MFGNTLRTVTVDVDILEYYIGNVYTCRNTTYSKLEAYMELVIQEETCITIKGQAKRWKWSEEKVRNFLNYLQKFGMLKISKGLQKGHYRLEIVKPGEKNEQG